MRSSPGWRSLSKIIGLVVTAFTHYQVHDIWWRLNAEVLLAREQSSTSRTKRNEQTFVMTKTKRGAAEVHTVCDGLYSALAVTFNDSATVSPS